MSSRTTIRTATTIAYREIQRLLRGYPTRESDSAGESRVRGAVSTDINNEEVSSRGTHLNKSYAV